MLTEATATCPYCWEVISLTVDLSEAHQCYIEDCPVCCHPMQVTVATEDHELAHVEVERAE